MADLSVIPKMPVRFSDVDTENWAAEVLCMLQNQDWKTRPHYLVGLEEGPMWHSTLAFLYVMKIQGVDIVKHKRDSVRQVISRKGLSEMDNVWVMGRTYPDTFFDLMEGAFAIPMGDSIDAISDAYDSGHPILLIKLTFKG